jgi:hypothetical protein
MKRYLGTILIWTINLILMALLTNNLITDANDKSPTVFIFGYLVILIFNLLVWGVTSLFNSPFSRQIAKVVMILSLLFVPLLAYMLNQ